MIRRAALLAALWAAASFAQEPPPEPDEEDLALERAFDPPGRPEAPSGPGHMDQDLPPPVAAPPPAETEEERAERELEADLGGAAADADFAALARRAAPMGPALSLRVAERWALAALASNAPQRAARARAWLMACGPGTAREIARCRRRALDAMREAGGAARAEAARLEEADQCVEGVAPGSGDRCLARAIATYRKSRDRLMLAKATLAGLELDDAAGRRAALKLCPEPRCAAFRATVLEQLAGDLLQSGAPGAVEQAVGDALAAVKQRQSALPASQRLYARTDALDRACAAYDRQTAKGRCRALELKALGGYVFRDFSRKSSGDLPPEEARAVTEHYTVLLTPCLQLHGEKSGSGRYRISWTILNDGRVTNVDAVNVDPRGKLMGCLKDQFTRWRYPKYRGEWQHVDQEFRVSGTTR